MSKVKSAVDGNAVMVAKHPAVVTAKTNAKSNDGSVILSTGIKGKILPVAASLVEEVTAKIKDPDVPMWYNEDKEREEPNPIDPTYLKEMSEANRKRGIIALDAMIMFGLELADPIPEGGTWVKKLKWLGIEFDDQDEFEREFAYKKYVACGNNDLVEISKLAGITQEAVEDAVKSFRG